MRARRATVGNQSLITTFDAYIASLLPVAWYKFQDANYNTATSLLDSSGANRHLPRVGASAVATGAAMRSTTTKSATMDTNGSTSNYWSDTAFLLTGFASNATAMSLLFSFKRTQTTGLAFAKNLGWRGANSNSVLGIYDEFGNDHSSITIGMNTSAGALQEAWIGNLDTNTHIYGTTFGSSQYRHFKDAVLAWGPTTLSANMQTVASLPFQIGGTMSSGSAAHFRIDHVSIYNKRLTDAEMIAAQGLYNMEKL